MIEFVEGNFFDYEADIRINTVNCVGVMKKGVALQFKNKYPEMFNEYAAACKRGEVEPGKPHVYDYNGLLEKYAIINLPTKVHWRNPSTYEYIEKDLEWLKNFLEKVPEASVMTLPALRCGYGGLEWNIVRNMICNYLKNIKAKILVFKPKRFALNKKI